MHISNHLPKAQDIFSSIGLPFRSLVFEKVTSSGPGDAVLNGTATCSTSDFFEPPKMTVFR